MNYDAYCMVLTDVKDIMESIILSKFVSRDDQDDHTETKNTSFPGQPTLKEPVSWYDCSIRIRYIGIQYFWKCWYDR